MNIVQIGNHFYPCIGGVERVISEISNYFSYANRVKVVCLNRCAYSSKKLSANGKFGNAAVERIPFLDLKYYKIATNVFSKIKWADIVHIHGIGFFSDFLLITKFLHKKPIIISTHGAIFHTKSLGILKNIYFFIFQKIILQNANRIIAVSKNDYELFSKISSKVELVENGVDVSKFRAGKKVKNSFLFVGRFAKNKRVEKLLEAFAQMKGKETFTLIIAGTDWEKLLESYKAKARELGINESVKCVLNPSQEELNALYSSSEYFVSASQYEGFGISLVEAMACGCIPIVQKNTGFANILNSGKNGFLCDFNDAQNAVGHITNALQLKSSEKNSLSKNALLRSKDFSWGEKFKVLEKIYSEEMK